MPASPTNYGVLKRGALPGREPCDFACCDAAYCWESLLLLIPQVAQGQSFGIELHNTVTPAAGAMGGVSIARPQGVMSAIHGNPASLTQFEGTQFMVGGAWAEPTYNLAHTGGLLPSLGAFAAKSEAEGTALGGFGLTQDLRALGIPVTTGMRSGGQRGRRGSTSPVCRRATELPSRSPCCRSPAVRASNSRIGCPRGLRFRWGPAVWTRLLSDFKIRVGLRFAWSCGAQL